MECCGLLGDGQKTDEVLQDLEAGSVVDVSGHEEVDKSSAKSIHPFSRKHFMHAVFGFVVLLVVAVMVYVACFRESKQNDDEVLQNLKDFIRVSKAKQDMIDLVSKVKGIQTGYQYKKAVAIFDAIATTTY
eukprot:114159_1